MKRAIPLAAALVLLLAACGGAETPPEETPEPASAAVIVTPDTYPLDGGEHPELEPELPEDIEENVMLVLSDCVRGMARPADGFLDGQLTGVDSYPAAAQADGETLDFYSPRYRLRMESGWTHERGGDVYALFLRREGGGMCLGTITAEQLERRYGGGAGALSAAALDMYAESTAVN